MTSTSMSQPTVLYLALVTGTIFISVLPYSHADNPDGITIPSECEPFSGGTEFVHVMSATKFPVPVDPDVPLSPGDTAIAIANFNNPLNDDLQTEEIKQIRFLWFDGTGTLQQETVVPVDTDATTLAQDMFFGVFGPNTTWEVVACYENTDRTLAGDTIHIDVDSFFVLPESPVGVFALIISSLATLGAFVLMRNRRSWTSTTQ